MDIPNPGDKRLKDQIAYLTKGPQDDKTENESEKFFDDLHPLENEVFLMKDNKLYFRDNNKEIPYGDDKYCRDHRITCNDIETLLKQIEDFNSKTSKDTLKDKLKNFKFTGTRDEDYKFQFAPMESVRKVLNKLQWKYYTDMYGIKRIQSYESYIEEHNNVQLDPLFEKFLKQLVRFVNHNPIVLGKPISKQECTYPENLGLKPYKPRCTEAAVDALRERIKDYRRSMAIRLVQGSAPINRPQLIFRGMDLSTPSFVTMRGGDSSRPALNLKYQQKYGVSKVFKDIYELNLKRLGSYNKSLSKNSKDAIEKQFKTLQEHENKIVQGINMLEQYAQIIAAKGDRSGETITLDKLEDIVRKYNHLLDRKERHELSLLSVIQALVKSVESETKESNKKVYEGVVQV